MRAMILAAGLGTRLGALSDERPKPLLPVADVPLLRYNLALLEAHGVTEVAINVFHRGGLIEEELAGYASEAGRTARITFSREDVLLGTGGGLHRMADFLTDGGRAPFLVLNGKLVIDVDLGALLLRHAATGAAATMVLRKVADAERWGAIELDERGLVSAILDEKRPGGDAPQPRTRTMFTGVHVVSPSLLARLPEGVSCVIRQGYQPALRAGETIAGFLYDGYFEEHSTPRRYLDGNIAVLRGRAALRHPPGPLVGVDPLARIGRDVTLREPFRVGPGAVVGDGAVIGPDAVIGRRATVAAGASIERAVLWPGAHASGKIAEAIVTVRGTFPVDEPVKG